MYKRQGGGELPASTAHGSDESLARESDHDESSATSIAEETDLGATRYDEAVDQGGQAAPVAELDEDMVLITSIPQHVGRSTVATALLSGDWPSALRGTERRPPAPPERQPWLGPAADLGDGGDHDGLTIARLPDDPESTPGVEVRGLWSVSYTHLDVYKRQGPGGSPCARFAPCASCLATEGDHHEPIRHVCLLYTSRCV